MKLWPKASKHLPNGQIILMVTIEACWIKDDWISSGLSHVATPEVSMKQRGENINAIEKLRHSKFEFIPEIMELCVTWQPSNLFIKLKIENTL